MDIVGLIPCAGMGTRLGLPFSKEMFPDIYNEGYRPIIMYTIEAMKKAGLKHLIFTINPGKTELLRFLGNGQQFGMNFSYVIHPEPLSLPESLDEAYHLIKDQVVAFAMPDTVIEPADFMVQLVEEHQSNQGEVTLGCFKTDNPTKFAMVDFEGDQILNIIEKPTTSNLSWMWGCMVWNPSFTQELHDFILQQTKTSEGELTLSEALMMKFVKKDQVKVYTFPQGRYRDLGTYDELIHWAAKEKQLTVK